MEDFFLQWDQKEIKGNKFRHCTEKRQIEQVTETGMIPQSYAASLEEGP